MNTSSIRHLRRVSVSSGSNILIKLQEVTRTFGQNVSALQNVSLNIARGTSYAITGSSGAGKSTLLNIIGLLDHPTSGRYLLNGMDVSHASDDVRSQLRCKCFGFVFQDFHLLSYRSVLENVMLGGFYAGIPMKQREAKARNLIDSVGLSNRIDFDIAHLSGGEKQRTVIARSLMNEPHILLCDEPTGNLDSETSHVILKLLLNLTSADVSVIIVTHDQSVAEKCEYQICVHDGKLNFFEMNDNLE